MKCQHIKYSQVQDGGRTQQMGMSTRQKRKQVRVIWCVYNGTLMYFGKNLFGSVSTSA